MSDKQTHELKIWKDYFDDVDSGRKPFEVRKLDRLFGTGDILHLREWGPITGYTGRETFKEITYVMAGGQWGLAEGNCIMGLKALHPSESPKGGAVWVKASKRFPEDWITVVLRQISTRRILIEQDISTAADEVFIMDDTSIIPYNDVEWLDDSAPTVQPNADHFELVFIPCAEYDPRAVGGYTSFDGQSLCHVREGHIPVQQKQDAGSGKEEKEFAKWLAENTQTVWENRIPLYRYCDKNNEWGNYTLDDIYNEYRNL